MTDKAANGLVRRGKGPTRPPTKETKDSSRRQHMDRVYKLASSTAWTSASQVKDVGKKRAVKAKSHPPRSNTSTEYSLARGARGYTDELLLAAYSKVETNCYCSCLTRSRSTSSAKERARFLDGAQMGAPAVLCDRRISSLPACRRNSTSRGGSWSSLSNDVRSS